MKERKKKEKEKIAWDHAVLPDFAQKILRQAAKECADYELQGAKEMILWDAINRVRLSYPEYFKTVRK